MTVGMLRLHKGHARAHGLYYTQHDNMRQLVFPKIYRKQEVSVRS
jgi:hypothetical protein